MATGSYSQAMKAANAARYLCEESLVYDRDIGLVDKNHVCIHDYSSRGLCWLDSQETWDTFARALPVRSLAQHEHHHGCYARLDMKHF
jgi:hypothetical protein